MRRIVTLALLAFAYAVSSHAETSTNTDFLEHTYYNSASWSGNGFTGTMFRDFDGNSLIAPTLLAQVNTTVGSWDAGIETKYDNHNVDSIHPNYWVRAFYNVSATGTGEWWVGPKMNVNWEEASNRYENYIIENSNVTQATWNTSLTTGEGGTYLGETIHNGATYKHYAVPKDTWMQMWAIRQTYRNGGIVSVKRVLNFWRKNAVHKMPNGTASVFRINVETFGSMNFEADINGVYIPVNYTDKPNSRATPCPR